MRGSWELDKKSNNNDDMVEMTVPIGKSADAYRIANTNDMQTRRGMFDNTIGDSTFTERKEGE